MDNFDYWRLSDELSIVQAALLIANADPSVDATYVEGWSVENRPEGYQAAKSAVMRALQRGAIDGNVVPNATYDMNGNVTGDEPGSVDLHESTVEVASLRRWLADRGFVRGFFFPDGVLEPDYLDPNSTRYAPKLAAAIRAWEAMSNPTRLEGRSPKQALSKWLREHAAEYGLTGEDGSPNDTGIEEVAKVANWQPTGGAPRTPT